MNLSAIEGFTFKSGYTYRLLVGVRLIQDPMTVDPSRSYRLRWVIARTAIPSA